MKSPFPGMNPFIEACGLWRDFHSHLIEKIFDAICPILPEKYVVRTGKRSYVVLVESDEKIEHHFEPDVKISGPPGRKPRGKNHVEASSNGGPVVLRAFIDTEFVEKFLDIYELEPERRLVTSIEILSPSNKRKGTAGWRKYLRKRQALLLGKANLVEIDLVRRGTRMPMLDNWPASPYYLLVARTESSPSCQVWPAHFDRRLPTIPVPLSRPDSDLALDLQPLIDGIYSQARYGQDIDYSLPLEPPLSAVETAWFKRRLAQAAPPKRSPQTAKKLPRR